jgi:hypothetical protein
LNAVSRRFGEWLRDFELVFSAKNPTAHEWYYLEGELRRRDAEIYALPAAADALRRGQYFVADDETEAVLDTLCKSLRLRGVQGVTEPTTP